MGRTILNDNKFSFFGDFPLDVQRWRRDGFRGDGIEAVFIQAAKVLGWNDEGDVAVKRLPLVLQWLNASPLRVQGSGLEGGSRHHARDPAREPEDPSPTHDGGGSPARRSNGGRKRSPSRSRSPSLEPASSPPATNQRVAELERLLASQDERIRQLFALQLAEPHEDVSSAYVVLDEVWHLLGKHASEDRCSWISIPALKRREISEIVRT